MRLIPIPIKARLNDRRRTRQKTKKVRPVAIPKSPGLKYRRDLLAFVNEMQQLTISTIVPILKQLEPEYVNDAYARTLGQAFKDLRIAFNNIDKNANIVATSFVNNADAVNKRRFYAAMNEAVGVNLSSIVQNEGLEDILLASTKENVSLITSLPDEYFKQIETMIYSNTTQGGSANSMIKQLRDIGSKTDARARLIARDQSSKLNSVLNQQRQQNLGVEEYVWRTAADGRVRETHRRNNGKTFRWDNPPKETGHPGQDIQCRCIAQAIVKI